MDKRIVIFGITAIGTLTVIKLIQYQRYRAKDIPPPPDDEDLPLDFEELPPPPDDEKPKGQPQRVSMTEIRRRIEQSGDKLSQLDYRRRGKGQELDTDLTLFPKKIKSTISDTEFEYPPEDEPEDAFLIEIYNALKRHNLHPIKLFNHPNGFWIRKAKPGETSPYEKPTAIMQVALNEDKIGDYTYVPYVLRDALNEVVTIRPAGLHSRYDEKTNRKKKGLYVISYDIDNLPFEPEDFGETIEFHAPEASFTRSDGQVFTVGQTVSYKHKDPWGNDLGGERWRISKIIQFGENKQPTIFIEQDGTVINNANPMQLYDYDNPVEVIIEDEKNKPSKKQKRKTEWQERLEKKRIAESQVRGDVEAYSADGSELDVITMLRDKYEKHCHFSTPSELSMEDLTDEEREDFLSLITRYEEKGFMKAGYKDLDGYDLAWADMQVLHPRLKGHEQPYDVYSSPDDETPPEPAPPGAKWYRCDDCRDWFLYSAEDEPSFCSSCDEYRYLGR